MLKLFSIFVATTITLARIIHFILAGEKISRHSERFERGTRIENLKPVWKHSRT